MEFKDKINYFIKQVNQSVHDTMDEQTNNYEEILQKDFENFKKQVDENYSARLESEKNALRKETNRNISKISFDYQHDLYVREEKLKESLFKKFHIVLDEYKSTQEYVDHLKRMIQSVQEYAKDEKYDIYIDPSDKSLLSELEQFSNEKLNISDRKFIGGIRGVIREREILLDYSFSTLLYRVEHNFSITEGISA